MHEKDGKFSGIMASIGLRLHKNDDEWDCEFISRIMSGIMDS